MWHAEKNLCVDSQRFRVLNLHAGREIDRKREGVEEEERERAKKK